MRSWLAATGLLLAVIPAGCRSFVAQTDARWAPDHSVLARADIQGDRVHIHNIRNCEYRTADDYTVRYYDKTFDLRQLNEVDYVVVPFSRLSGGAHTFLTFGFGDGQYVAVSIEARRERGKSIRPARTLVPYYQLIYVIADERDVVKLRTNYRQNDVYLYRIRAAPNQQRALFLDVLHRANSLASRPEYYHVLNNNCATNVFWHLSLISPRPVPYNWQVLLPANSDRLAYNLGLIDTHLPFDQAKTAARVNDQAYRYANSPDFSSRLRR